MALFFIDYDLRKARDYQPLYDELARLKAVRVLESCWCFKRVNTTCKALREHFRKFVDADDGLSVVEVTDWATWNAVRTPNDL